MFNIVFTNINIYTMCIFIIGCVLICFFLVWGKRKQKNIYEIVFLSLCVFTVLMMSFVPKGGPKKASHELNGYNILFALDVSKSMNALDYKEKQTFSRRDAAKKVIRSLLEPSNQYGLIIFSGESLEILPLSSSVGLFQTVLSGVTDASVGKYGSNLSDLFLSIPDFFLDDDGGVVIIFTDGGDEEAVLSSSHIQKLAEKNIKVILVGVGNKEGSYIPNGKDIWGNIIYKTYNGQKVITKLNESTLKNLSREYNFEYFYLKDMSGAKHIKNMIRKKGKPISINHNHDIRYDFTRIFAFIAFLFFSLYLLFSQFLGKK